MSIENTATSTVANTTTNLKEQTMQTKLNLVANTSQGFEADILRYAAEAGHITTTMLCGDVDLAVANVELGLASLSPEVQARIGRALPEQDLAVILDLGRLANTVGYLARQSPATVDPVLPKGKIREIIKRGWVLKEIISPQLDVLLHAGLLPADEHARLVVSRGPIGLANYLIDSVAAFTHHEESFAGKVQVPQAVLDEAKELGDLIKKHVRPKKSAKAEPPARSDRAKLRDQLWTLLCQRHAELRRIAGYIWLDKAASKVPGLQKRQRKSRKPAKVAATQPAAPSEAKP